MMVPRFFEKVSISDNPRGCFLWTGNLHSAGYGYYGNKKAHRYAYELANDGIDPELFVCHLCDVRNCVRPSHLVLGTQADNVRDAWAKGRGRAPVFPGELNPQAKLTADQVRELRSKRETLGLTFKQLAKEFGVSASNAFNAVKGISFVGVV